MSVQSLYKTFKRYRTLQTDVISSMPIAILMPHSSCNCRCVMCDIWKNNNNLTQLSEKDIEGLLGTLQKLGTRQILMSGGEALLHPAFFSLCKILKDKGLHITLLSTGLLIKKHVADILQYIDDIIVSLDGDESTHDAIRNVPNAYKKMSEGIAALKASDPGYPVSARSVIHSLNFRNWKQIIETAKHSMIDHISFLPADVSSEAFNREVLWTDSRQNEILISRTDLPELQEIVEEIIIEYATELRNGFIAESPEKLRNIYTYYSAAHGLSPYPFKKCNAPWVSTVIEADGTVRPCFFHASIGNIHEKTLPEILNGDKGLAFRRELNMQENSTCIKCVCYLNLSAGTDPVQKRKA